MLEQDEPEDVNCIFKEVGPPTITYVARSDGEYEDKLKAALDSGGTICLITGPSKTGKTSLYTRVIQEKKRGVVRVRCNTEMTSSMFWRYALEAVDFERVESLSKNRTSTGSLGGEISGGIGLPWLFGVMGKTNIAVGNSRSNSESAERVLADPGPQHLIPVLRTSGDYLVVEDFHYLPVQVRKVIFQQWKTFVDNEVSVVVVGTTHHAVDFVQSNKDLIGRMSHINMKTWDTRDLETVILKGLNYLNIQMKKSLITLIAKESIGLPTVTQSVCLQLMRSKGIHKTIDVGPKPYEWDRKEITAALHKVAKAKYAPFEQTYQRFIEGPRKNARKFDTYELVLRCFSEEPETFSLSKNEIQKKIEHLSKNATKTPSGASVDSFLRAIGSFQKRMEIELLEWNQHDQKLYIIEPAFLFYLRWRVSRDTPPTASDLIKEILDNMIRKQEILEAALGKGLRSQ